MVVNEQGAEDMRQKNLRNYLEEVNKVVAVAVCAPVAYTIDPVTMSLCAGTSSEVG